MLFRIASLVAFGCSANFLPANAEPVSARSQERTGMTSVPSFAGLPFLAASQRTTRNSQLRIRVAMIRLFVVLVLIGAASFASGQTAHFDGAQTFSISGCYTPGGFCFGTDTVSIAVDAAGDIIFTSQNGALAQMINASTCTYSGPGSALYVWLASTKTLYILGGNQGGLNAPTGLAFDSSGNLYVLDSSTSAIYKFLGANGSIQIVSTYGSGALANGPYMVAQAPGNGCADGDMAMDASGNLYYTSTAANTVNEILAVNGVIPPSPTITTLGSGFDAPAGIAVDSNGDVFVANALNNTVKEMVAVNGSIPASPTIRTLGSGFNLPVGLALDSQGDLYVADDGNNALKEILAVDGSIPDSPNIRILGTYSEVEAVTLDKSGDIFGGGSLNNGANLFELTPSGANFGQVNVGATAPAIPMVFTFDTAGTLKGISVLTQGASGLDFSNAGSGTCTVNTTYSVGQSCTVSVTFAPKFAGLRMGAVELSGSSGIIATAYASGIGTGPQIAFEPGVITTLGGGFGNPFGVAVDASGNIYVADTSNNAVKEMPPGCASSSCATSLGGGFKQPFGVAVDGSGQVYVADTYDNLVKEMPPGCASSGCAISLGGEFKSPQGVAVDGSGNVFVADAGNNAVKEMPSGCASSSCVTTLGGDFSFPYGVAVDGAGEIYVADTYNGAVKEMPPGCTSSSCVTTLGGGFSFPSGVAIDGAGDVYVADSGNDALKEMPSGCASTNCVTTLGGGFSAPRGTAVDESGNVYVADFGNSAVKELNAAAPPSFNFPTATAVDSTDTADGILTAQVFNIGNMPLVFSGLTYPTDFSEASDMNPCTNSTSLTAGQECDIPVEFAPLAPGSPLSENVTLTNNNLNKDATCSSPSRSAAQPNRRRPRQCFHPRPAAHSLRPQPPSLGMPASPASQPTISGSAPPRRLRPGQQGALLQHQRDRHSAHQRSHDLRAALDILQRRRDPALQRLHLHRGHPCCRRNRPSRRRAAH